MKPVRTRFAPSPTGFLHVGGVRTALFSWLLAKHYGGSFLLRIEDTDQERLVPGAIQAIIEGFQWLGMTIDEGPSVAELKQVGSYWDGAPDLGGTYGPYIQSLRLERYREVAEQLVREGHAYRCDCSAERLAQEREIQMARREPPGYSGHCRERNVSEASKHVIRLKIPRDRIFSLPDAIRGNITWQSLSLRDPVLLKSDGYPTYHLAVVVDDHAMEISHIIRAEEWIPSAPIHIMLYEVLGWEPPVFAHVPNVLGADGKKLSKRHGATSVGAFGEEGYLPEALMNFLVLIGWSPGDGDDQEIFTTQEMIEKFSLEHVNKAGGVFAYDKLKWMNGMYIRQLPEELLKERIRPHLIAAGISVDEEKFTKILPHVRERLERLTDAPALLEFLFVDNLPREIESMFQKNIDAKKAKEILLTARPLIERCESFNAAGIEECVKGEPERLDVKTGPYLVTLRIAVTGKKVTPPLFASMECLGKSICLKRIDEAVTELEKKHGA